jgi:hypothetical protein
MVGTVVQKEYNMIISLDLSSQNFWRREGREGREEKGLSDMETAYDAWKVSFCSARTTQQVHRREEGH